MLRKVLLFLIALCCAFDVLSQETDNWYFGYNAGITFKTNPPTAIFDGKLYTEEGCASMSGVDGKVLFYTNGVNVWDRTHTIMPNGTELKGHRSSAQSAIIIPRPMHSDQYYIFTVGDELRYSEVDMTLNSANGDIPDIKKNILLKPSVSEKLTAIQHPNGIDYWVLAVQLNNDTVFVFEITSSGIIAAPVSVIPSLNGSNSSNAIGCVKISPDGRKIAFTNTKMGRVILGDFDPYTGKVSNTNEINGKYCYQPYGVEFSPKGKYLYISSGPILQYDLTINTTNINTSETIVGYSFPDKTGSLQTGPDGKIYIAAQNSSYLSIIHTPDSLQSKCRFQKNYIPLGSGKCMLGLPSFVQVPAKPLNIGKDTAICSGDSLTLKCDRKDISMILWNTGETTKKILITKEGKYSVIVVTKKDDVFFDTIQIKTRPKFRVFIGNDTTFCGKFSHRIKTNKPFEKYYWNTGTSNLEITVNKEGIYFVKVHDSNNCSNGDTIAIDQVYKPVIKQHYDSINCQYVYLSVDSVKGLTYQWNTGENRQQIAVKNKGWYSITANHQFCSIKDSVYIESLPIPDVNLGPDTSLCAHEILLNTHETGRYFWSTAVMKPSITINSPGEYWLKVSRNNCSASDTIQIQLCVDMQYFIPTTFTPNNDNINDVFKVSGTNIDHIEMYIYNRWGEKIFETKGKEVGWDGHYLNEICTDGIYIYRLTLHGNRPGNVKYLNGDITLLR